MEMITLSCLGQQNSLHVVYAVAFFFPHDITSQPQTSRSVLVPLSGGNGPPSHNGNGAALTCIHAVHVAQNYNPCLQLEGQGYADLLQACLLWP